MASPWLSHTTQRRPAERPWMGMALLLAVPFLSLILIRMLWSGSSLWFLMAGIALLGAAAVVLLSRRHEPAYGYQTLAPEPNRLPLVLLGLGALFLALLILPNFSSGSASPATGLQTTGSTARLTHASQPVALPTAAQQTQHIQATLQQPTPTTRAQTSSQSDQPSTASNPPAGSQIYKVQADDTLWDIAQKFNTTVDDIVAANKLDNASDLQLGQELVIPAPSDTGATAAQ
jgi:LysM repeat protein